MLCQDIRDELEFEPRIDAGRIEVAVTDGRVNLTGRVPNLAQKYLVERVVRRVSGVLAVAENLVVEPESDLYSDDDLAKRALTVLDLNVLIPTGKIQVRSADSWLTLSGEVEWHFQRDAAIADLCKLRGVRGISSKLTLKPRPEASDITGRIEEAMRRSVAIEPSSIAVTVADGRVRLEGEVERWSDRQTIERVAWSTPGVVEIEDRVHVGHC